MITNERFQEIQVSAMNKLKDGIELNKQEAISLDGKAFYNFAWDYFRFNDFVEKIGDKKPNDIIWDMIVEQYGV